MEENPELTYIAVTAPDLDKGAKYIHWGKRTHKQSLPKENPDSTRNRGYKKLKASAKKLLAK